MAKTINGQRKINVNKGDEDSSYYVTFILKHKKGERNYSGEDQVADNTTQLIDIANSAGIKHIAENQAKDIEEYVEKITMDSSTENYSELRSNVVNKLVRKYFGLEVKSAKVSEILGEKDITIVLKEEYNSETIDLKVEFKLKEDN